MNKLWKLIFFVDQRLPLVDRQFFCLIRKQNKRVMTVTSYILREVCFIFPVYLVVFTM